MDYDIFISYRREGGLEYARPIKAELEKRGYRVFLDFDELKDGVFDRRIMDAIDAAPIFMIIVSEHSLERCMDTNDWVRKEIEYAIAKQKHFIPVNPDYQFKGYPEGFPEFLKMGMGRHQFSDIVLSQLFKASMSEMITNRIEPFLGSRTNRPAAQEETEGAIIHIETDLDCRVLKFGKEIAIAYAGKDNTIRLRKGKHKLEFASLENEADRTTSVPSPYAVDDNDSEDFLSVQLLPIKSAREKKESKEQGQTFSSKISTLKSEREKKTLEEPELFPKKSRNGKYGFVDKSGKEIIPFKYDDAGRFFEMLALVKLGRKHGFIDKNGNEVIPIKYYDAENFSEGFACVKKNGKYGFIDKAGNMAIPPNYDSAHSFSEGLARVYQDGKWGFIDKAGNAVIPPNYDFAWCFSEGLAAVKLDGKWGFIDKTENAVIPIKYDDANSFSKGLARVELDGKWGFIDKTENAVIPIKYDYADSFSEGLVLVADEDKGWAFVDKDGKVVVPFNNYDCADSFSEGLARVELDGKYGFIDKAGNVVISIKYDVAKDFSEGFACVKLDGKWGYIDKSGKWVKDARQENNVRYD